MCLKIVRFPEKYEYLFIYFYLFTFISSLGATEYPYLGAGPVADCQVVAGKRFCPLASCRCVENDEMMSKI